MALADLISLASLGGVRPMPMALGGPVMPIQPKSPNNATAVNVPLSKTPGPNDYLDSMVKAFGTASEDKLRQQQGAYQKAQEESLRQQMQIRTNLPAMGQKLLDTPMEQGVGDQYNKVLDITGNAPPQAASSGKKTAAPSPELDKITEGDPPEWRAFAQSVAGPESGGKFNVRYTPQGGANFDSYVAHPNVAEPIPGDPMGRTSSAAGAFQIVNSTWNSLPEETRQNFEPGTQYSAFKQIARRDYAANTRRDLDADLKAGNLGAIAQGLKGTWPVIGMAMKAYPTLYASYAQSDPAVQAAQSAPPVPALGGPANGMTPGRPSPAPTPASVTPFNANNLSIPDPGGAAPVSQMNPDDIRAAYAAARSASPLQPGTQPSTPGYAAIGAPGVKVNSQGMPYSASLETMSPQERANNAAAMASIKQAGGLGARAAPLAAPPNTAAQAEQALMRLAQSGSPTPLPGALPPQQAPMPPINAPPRPAQSMPPGASLPGAVAPSMMPGALAPRPMPPQGAPMNAFAPQLLPIQPQMPALPQGVMPNQYTMTPYEKNLIQFDMQSRLGGMGDLGAAALSNYQNSPYMKARQAAAEKWGGTQADIFSSDYKAKMQAQIDMMKAGPIAEAQEIPKRTTQGEAPQKVSAREAVVYSPNSAGAQSWINAQKSGMPLPPNVNIGQDGGVRIGGGNEGVVGETVAKFGIQDLIDKRRPVAVDAANALDSSVQARGLLDNGVITGAGANFKLELGRILQSSGIWHGDDDAIANTETFTSAQARAVAGQIKAFGSGTAISNADREYTSKMVGGNITLTEQSLRKILDIGDHVSHLLIDRYNKDASKVDEKNLLPYPLVVEKPEPYKPKAKPISGVTPSGVKWSYE